MVTSDPIADMLTRIRNALMVGKSTVLIPKSGIKIEIARVLKEEGFIADYSVQPQQPVDMLEVVLKYDGDRRHRRPVISHIERISKPGRRIYRGRHDLPRVLSGTGIAIMTTPKGVMTAQRARQEHTGGEVLCYVW